MDLEIMRLTTTPVVTTEEEYEIDDDSVPPLRLRDDASYSDSEDESDTALDDDIHPPPPIPTRSVATARLPPREDFFAAHPGVDVPPVLRDLHRSSADVCGLGISIEDYYRNLEVSEMQLHRILPPKGHVDGGSLATTTDRRDYLFNYRAYTRPEQDSLPRLKVADDSLHVPTGHGYIKIPSSSPPYYMYAKSYYTPEIPATIISPHALAVDGKADGYHAGHRFSAQQLQLVLYDVPDSRGGRTNHIFDLESIRGLLYTPSLIQPTPQEQTSFTLPVRHISHAAYSPTPSPLHDHEDHQSLATDSISALSIDEQRALWHCRIGHQHDRLISDLHKHAVGIPKLPRGDALHTCPMCARAKLRKSDRGPLIDRELTHCWQDIQIDFGFMVQRSSGKRPPPQKTTSASSPPDLEVRLQTRSQRRHDLPMPPEAPPEPPVPSQAVTSRASSQPRSTKRQAKLRRQRAAYLADPTSQQRYVVTRIKAHQGPLTPDHKNYRDYPINLKVEWATGGTTWEPLPLMFEDVPDLVIAYAKSRNVLGSRHWEFVRDAALHHVASPRLPTDADYDHETEDPRHPSGTAYPAVSPLDPATVQGKADNANARFQRLKGLNGETCYVRITCMRSGACKTSIRKDKSPPLDFLREFLARYTPDVPHKICRLDQGGELGRCTEVLDLFQQAGYEIQIVAQDSSNEIGGVERSHLTLANAVRTMLFGAGLPLKFWPYALQYWDLINDCIPHGTRGASPYEICTGRQPDVSRLRVFGCRVYALPAEGRDGKLDVHAAPGIFLGYKRTMRHAYYFDLKTSQVKIARHVAFDESMADLPPDQAPPYVRFLRGDSPPPTPLDLADPEPDIQINMSPFTHVVELDLQFSPAQSSAALGFIAGRCPQYLRAYVSDVTGTLGTYSALQARRKFLGAYVLKVGDFYTFTPDQVVEAILHYSALPAPPTRLPVRFALDTKAALSEDRPPALHLRPLDVRRITAINLLAGEGSHISQRARIRTAAQSVDHLCTPPDPDDVREYSPEEILEMRKMTNDHMTPEERELKSFSYKAVRGLPNWQEWSDAHDKQLDTHFHHGTIGKAVLRPPPKPGEPEHVYRTVWSRLVKPDGTRKARMCLDGSKRAAPWLRGLVQTYSSCIEIPALRLLIATMTNLGLGMSFADVYNAFQQSPPPTHQCYVEFDPPMIDWYRKRFNVELDWKRYVIPLNRALQGHPEASALWERLITDILVNKMHFTSVTHERNIYMGKINDRLVLAGRQVDDFIVGSKREKERAQFLSTLQEYVEAEYMGMGTLTTNDGVYQRYNGLDVHQTRHYNKISCESYIQRLLQTHGWDSPKKPDSPVSIPMTAAEAEALQKVEGPPAKSAEAKQLEKENGFAYRNLLGELMYAYVICRLDIGFAVCLLARFSSAPHAIHFQALKRVCKYLRATASWGIMYWRPSPMMDLPEVPFTFVQEDPNLPAFPKFYRKELAGLLDAAHATDLRTRRSVTGLLVILCGAAIAWRSKLQSLVATSSTEAEFYSAVELAKMIKYFRYILRELGMLLPGPCLCYIDNQAALNMINESHPTPHARHVETQHFAIQEWQKAGEVHMKHLPGTVNAPDALTKPMTAVLHYRHCPRAMGHYLPDFKEEDSGSPSTSPMLVDTETSEAGEGVGADKVRAPSAPSSVLKRTEKAREDEPAHNRSVEEEDGNGFVVSTLPS